LIVERTGLPLSIGISAADTHDSQGLHPRVRGIYDRLRRWLRTRIIVPLSSTSWPSALMLGDASADQAEVGSFAAPAALGGGTSVTLHVFVPDVDSLAERAEAAGAEILQPPTDMFHGDRTVILKDPSGHMWVFLTHLEDVSKEELRRRLVATG
jgi:hypothetical protein